MPRKKKGIESKIKLPPDKLSPAKVTPTPPFLKIFTALRSRTPTGPKTKVPLPSPSDKLPRLPKLSRAKRPSRTPTGPKTKVPLPSPSDKLPRLPKLFHALPSHHPASVPINLPHPRSKFDAYPHLIRVISRLKSLLLKVEPDKPIRMPRFPTFSFPPLYTRYSIMKTYTDVTDADGKITVTFPRVFRKIPGVVLTPNDPGTWFSHVLSKNEFGFTVQILKTAHAHQHASSGTEGAHLHTHASSGTEGAHLHTHANSGTEGAHLHTHAGSGSSGGHYHGGSSDYNGGHLHTIGTTGLSLSSGVSSLGYGSACASGNCVTGYSTGWYVDEANHSHSESSEPNHDHLIDTDTEPNHAHTVPNSNTEPDHAHTVPNSNTEPDHAHTVPDSNEKEASLLANTSVTFTYFAQEES